MPTISEVLNMSGAGPARAAPTGSGDAQMQQFEAVLARVTSSLIDQQTKYQQAAEKATAKVNQDGAASMIDRLRAQGKSMGVSSAPLFADNAASAAIKADWDAVKKSLNGVGDELKKVKTTVDSSKSGAVDFAAKMFIAKQALAAVAGGMDFAAGAINTLNNSSLTTAQQFRGIAESIPIVGGVVKAFNDLDRAIMGVTERLRLTTEAAQRMSAMQGVAGRFAPLLGQAYTDTAFARNRVAAVRGLSAVESPTARTTLGEQQRYQEAQALLPLEQARRLAAVQAATTQRNVQTLRDREIELVGERNNALSQARAASERVAGLRASDRGPHLNEPQIARALSLQAAYEEMARQKDEERLRITQQRIGLERQGAQDSFRAAQATLAVEQQKLEALKQREQTATANARRLGAMNPLEFEFGAQALQQYLANPQGVPNEIRDMARGIAPQTVGNIEEGIGDSRRSRVLGLAPDEFRDSLGSIRPQVNAQQVVVNAQLVINEGELARRLADLTNGLVQSLRTQMVQAMDLAAQNVNTRNAQAANAR